MIRITCNMGSWDLPDMYVLSPRASGIHIRQIPPAHVTAYTCSCYNGQSHQELMESEGLNKFLVTCESFL